MVGRWNFLSGWPIFRGYVSFMEGRSSEVLRHMKSSMEFQIYFCKSLWWTYTVNVGKYTIHGSYWYLLGIANTPLFYDFCWVQLCQFVGMEGQVAHLWFSDINDSYTGWTILLIFQKSSVHYTNYMYKFCASWHELSTGSVHFLD